MQFYGNGLLSRDYGIINAILGVVGIPPIDWLSDPYWIIIAFVMTGLFTIGGSMIINLAGLQSIPTDPTDAARVDGAGPVATFMNVTLPMMTPVLFYNLIIGIVGAMQSFPSSTRSHRAGATSRIPMSVPCIWFSCIE